MPTSSQSQILSVVDYQLLQQQQQTLGHDVTTIKPSGRSSRTEGRRRTSKDDRRPSVGRKNEEEKQSLSPPRMVTARQSSSKMNDKKLKDFRRAQSKSSVCDGTPQRTDVLHPSVIDLNNKTHIQPRRSIESAPYRRTSLTMDHPTEVEYKLRSARTPTGHNSSASDLEDLDDEVEQQSSLLNDSSRRLLFLGTIRPSRSFYRDLPASDVEYLMEYFHRMKNTNRKVSSDEINEELQNQSTEYKPKMFYDSATVTKSQVNNIEKLVQPYAEMIQSHQAELVKLDSPFRFIIKSMTNDTPLTMIPREFNDCLLTLVSRSDPLRKSDLIAALIPERLFEDIKMNSLDISYFPGGINYDVPRDEIDENGQMKLETYQKLKKRLNHRKVWYFTSPPEKKPHAVIVIIPSNLSTIIDHQRLLDCLYDRLKTSSNKESVPIEEKILSIEFVPLSCILGSEEIANEFLIDCDSNETKQQLMEKPLKINLNKQSISLEFQSYDEQMQREYNKSIKAEKYRELLKNHDAAVVKRTSTK